jgi:hypothetical protein
LEVEIVALRSELMSVRRDLDRETISLSAIMAQLERDRVLLKRAKEAFAELSDK